jgi:HAD superfamily hydrolase (TIGR01509 family)
MAIEAVIFDVDGVLVDSEHAWEAARRDVALGSGGRWRDGAQAQMMGMSTPEWTDWMREELGVQLDPAAIFRRVTERMEAGYRQELPLLPGATDVVRALAARWALAVASSSSRVLIDLVLELSELGPCFRATVSSEEVERGKPAPDVYLEAARKLGVDPQACAVIEDSTNGIRAGAAAGMHVIAVPERDFPPDADALGLAEVVLGSLEELRPEVVERL